MDFRSEIEDAPDLDEKLRKIGLTERDINSLTTKEKNLSLERGRLTRIKPIRLAAIPQTETSQSVRRFIQSLSGESKRVSQAREIERRTLQKINLQNVNAEDMQLLYDSILRQYDVDGNALISKPEGMKFNSNPKNNDEIRFSRFSETLNTQERKIVERFIALKEKSFEPNITQDELDDVNDELNLLLNNLPQSLSLARLNFLHSQTVKQRGISQQKLGGGYPSRTIQPNFIDSNRNNSNRGQTPPPKLASQSGTPLARAPAPQSQSQAPPRLSQAPPKAQPQGIYQTYTPKRGKKK